MCRFFSGLYTRDGRLLANPVSDEHEDQIGWFGLNDGNDHLDRFVRFEFTPPERNGFPNHADCRRYTLRVDERETPAWFDDEAREKLTAEASRRIQGMIVTDKRAVLLGGVWIVGGKARVGVIKSARVLSISDSAQVGYISDAAQVINDKRIAHKED